MRGRKLGDDAGDAGQHVHVLMAVEMADRDTCVAHPYDLRLELATHLGQADAAANLPAQQLHDVRRKLAVWSYQSGGGFSAG